MVKYSKNKPTTPIRKRFLDFFKPSITLGKRDRDTNEAADSTAHLHISSAPSVIVKPSSSVALQNEDKDLKETVIVTTLETIPFCCHEDLLTMTRPQLLSVAEALNEKLPAALRIEIKYNSPDTFIRTAIELIVGIKRTVPAAPRAMKLGLVDNTDPDKSVSPPTSPLAMKTRTRDEPKARSRLAILQEEDENSIPSDTAERVGKKRRVSGEEEAIPVTKRRRMSTQAAVPVRRTRSARVAPSSPTPVRKFGMTRTKSQRVPTSQVSPPRSSRVLRSHSQKLPSEMRNMEIDTAFITIQRPRYRFQPRPKSGMTFTSTPTRKTDAVAFDVPTIANYRETTKDTLSVSTSTSTNGRSITSISVESVSSLATPRARKTRTKSMRGIKRSPGSDAESEDDDANMTFALHGMTMAVSGSDMDISD